MLLFILQIKVVLNILFLIEIIHLLWRLDYDGLWINGTAFVCPDNTGRAIYESIMEAFRSKNSFDVGSQEGVNRSTAYYEYIKYISYEPTE